MERPIIFSAPMVRAILDDRKTQTRRVLKPHPAPNAPHDGGTQWVYNLRNGLHVPVGTVGHLSVAQKMGIRCPYGRPGDRLWVREMWTPGYTHVSVSSGGADVSSCEVIYKASEDGPDDPAWRSPIHMPRWASRITLEIVEVCVQRLQDISDSDSLAEGVVGTGAFGSYRREFAAGWDHINGKRAPWSSNPWVWALTFRRVP